MPIYEYTCDKCHAELEILQKVDEEAPKKCSSCGALNSLHKNVSSSAFHLKGGGWYKDLYSSTKPTTSESTKSDDKIPKKVDDKKD
jgi:putative FmdB family regulatory protein